CATAGVVAPARLAGRNLRGSRHGLPAATPARPLHGPGVAATSPRAHLDVRHHREITVHWRILKKLQKKTLSSSWLVK
ncbi:hypothetical protein ACJX0J_022265, partial [Zea mays]